VTQHYPGPLELLADHLARHPDQPYLHQPVARVWRSHTWREVDDQARCIAAGLLAQGYAPGDRIAILAKNCAEWFIVDLAIIMAGMVSVPIYTTAAAGTIRYVMEHSESKAVFLGKLDDTAAAEEGIPAGVLRIAMPYPTAVADQHWNDWLQSHTPLATLAEPEPESLLTLVYTSGSTGTPKGVAVTHRNMAASAFHTRLRADPQPGDRVISYLPLAHIAERAVVEHTSFGQDIEVFFVESLDTFADDLRHVRPAAFVSVPRLWTRFQAQVLAKMPDQRLQLLLRVPLVGGLVAARIRRAMGLDRARLFGSGTAPIAPALLEWYHRVGISISEGWGMTETTGLSCSNQPYRRDWTGTIGHPLDCVEMKLSEEGEILIRGDSVFGEYYKAPEITAAAFVDGWFRTGDLGEQRPDGAWRIIGRVKEQFKTGKGKYVSPVPIESELAACPLIEQVCVMGSGRKQPLALVVLAPGQGDRAAADAALRALRERVNAVLESHERLDCILVCPDPWTIENGMLTPTMKLKRDRIEAVYAARVEALASPEPLVWLAA
jgi:long-subunit acyl-CoA synthetase (AMP-forming)